MELEQGKVESALIPKGHYSAASVLSVTMPYVINTLDLTHYYLLTNQNMVTGMNYVPSLFGVLMKQICLG